MTAALLRPRRAAICARSSSACVLEGARSARARARPPRASTPRPGRRRRAAAPRAARRVALSAAGATARQGADAGLGAEGVNALEVLVRVDARRRPLRRRRAWLLPRAGQAEHAHRPRARRQDDRPGRHGNAFPGEGGKGGPRGRANASRGGRGAVKGESCCSAIW